MKFTGFFSAVLQLFVIIFTLALGLLFFCFSWVESLSYGVAQILLYKPENFTPLGLIFLGLTIFLTLTFYFIFRHKYIRIENNSSSYEIDINIIKKNVEKYFQESFDVSSIEIELSSFRNNLDIIIYLPSNLQNYPDSSLKKLSENLSNLLKNEFSYKRKTILTFKKA